MQQTKQTKGLYTSRVMWVNIVMVEKNINVHIQHDAIMRK